MDLCVSKASLVYSMSSSTMHIHDLGSSFLYLLGGGLLLLLRKFFSKKNFFHSFYNTFLYLDFSKINLPLPYSGLEAITLCFLCVCMYVCIHGHVEARGQP